jgi:hypothetical protein
MLSFESRTLLTEYFTLVSCLAYSSTLKIKAAYSSETSVDFQRNKWCYIPEGRTVFFLEIPLNIILPYTPRLESLVGVATRLDDR